MILSNSLLIWQIELCSILCCVSIRKTITRSAITVQISSSMILQKLFWNTSHRMLLCWPKVICRPTQWGEKLNLYTVLVTSALMVNKYSLVSNRSTWVIETKIFTRTHTWHLCWLQEHTPGIYVDYKNTHLACVIFPQRSKVLQFVVYYNGLFLD